MYYYALKVAVTAIVIVTITELARRSTGFAALIASLPLTSLLAFVWLHAEGAEALRIAELSSQIFWLVLPSLILFLLLPLLIKNGLGFWSSLSLSVIATVVCYALMLPLLRKLGVQL